MVLLTSIWSVMLLDKRKGIIKHQGSLLYSYTAAHSVNIYYNLCATNILCKVIEQQLELPGIQHAPMATTFMYNSHSRRYLWLNFLGCSCTKRSWSWKICIQIQALSLSSFMVLIKTIFFLEPQFPLMSKTDRHACLKVVWGDVRKAFANSREVPKFKILKLL